MEETQTTLARIELGVPFRFSHDPQGTQRIKIVLLDREGQQIVASTALPDVPNVVTIKGLDVGMAKRYSDLSTCFIKGY